MPTDLFSTKKPNRALETSYNKLPGAAKGKKQWERADAAKLVSAYETRDEGISQRDFSEKAGVPRSTLLYWLSRKSNIDADPFLVEFFENPVGIAFLHRLITAAHVSFTKDGTASIHNVVDFLEKSGLSSFVASSYSSQRRVSEKLDKKIIEFGEIEGERLAQQMPMKIVTLCEDETFHPEVCLVAMEPVSNFILVEKYAMDRKTKTWDEAVSDALKKLPVEVIQVASDEGRSLVSHALKGLKVHHSPDCFHVIYEIGKGTCGALLSEIRKSEKGHEKAAKQTLNIEREKEIFDTAERRPRGRRPHFEQRVEQARQEEEVTKKNLEKARSNYKTVRDAKAEIGTVYHPYSLKSGEKQDCKTVSQLLSGCFDRIYEATKDLSDRCRERVNKAQRVVTHMLGTIAFFFKMVDIYIENMHLSDGDKWLMTEYLIPGYYLKLAAEKERDVNRKAQILKKAKELLSVIRRLEYHGGIGPDCRIEKLEKAARECAEIFQRSSSCVEGRNAQLALRHQGIHRLSNRHLKALTVMHNYYVRRRDGTTAAERLFEAKPNDLFEFLLDKMDYPARPRSGLIEMRLRPIANRFKRVLPYKVYYIMVSKLSALYQEINYNFLPLIIRKRPVLKLDQEILGRFLVTTANGLFLIENNTMYELLEGNFFGLTLWCDKILVYRTYGHKGRIISFMLKSPLTKKEKCVQILDGLPHGCHQLDVVGDKLYIADTYNNRIMEFNLKTRKSVDYFPCGRLLNGRNSTNYAHINSLYFYNNEIFFYCHNETSKTGKKSTILLTDQNFEQKKFLRTGSGNGHNIVVYDGHLYHCDSLGKSLKRGNDIVFQSGLFTRGLSISKECIVLGGSEFAEKDKRAESKGCLYFLTHGFDLLYSCMVPGPVHEVRRIDSKDFSLSNLGSGVYASKHLP